MYMSITKVVLAAASESGPVFWLRCSVPFVAAALAPKSWITPCHTLKEIIIVLFVVEKLNNHRSFYF